MHQVVRQLLRKDNLPAYAAIGVSVAGIFLTDKLQLIAIFGILALIAVNTITERVTYFNEIMDAIRRGRSGLRSRHEGDFVDFEKYVQGAKIVLVAGLSLDFICTHKQGALVEKETAFRFISVDPDSHESYLEKLAEHDERASSSAKNLRSELERARLTLTAIKKARGPTAKPIIVKAGKGIPACTVTIVDPDQPGGKIRVEFRLYRRNFGPRPYIEFRRDSVEDSHWYHHFKEQYFERLWEDSSEIPLD
jgi:hypothetical protein